MKFLLDTNVVSEWSNPEPSENVVRWVYSQRREDLAISILTYHEIAYGIDQKQEGRRRARLEAWFGSVLLDYIQDRVIPIDRAIARRWAERRAEARPAGRQVPIFDAGIMATAWVHELTIVTGDRRHFGASGVRVINPWSGLTE